jgi:pimeloyl-ACP methyl ester carboxylesterase
LGLPLPTMTDHTFPVHTARVHGHELAYVRAGRGPRLLLLHGLGCDHRTWLPVMTELSRHFTVIAPDLLGHGRSAKPRADYSIAGYANGVRDLLTVLGVDRVTVVGHSLGGGVALQFAYQFPERVERLCLVSSGGIGADVSMLLRLVSLPVVTPVLAAMTTLPVRRCGSLALKLLAKSRLSRLRDAGELRRIYEQLGDPDTRLAFRSVVRGVIDWNGQIITLTDRAYLAQQMPVCVVWGDRDPVIPPAHAQMAAEHLPAARVEVLGNAGHFPHQDHPEHFAAIVGEFVTGTAPARYHAGRWRALLRRGPAPGLRPVPVAAES